MLRKVPKNFKLSLSRSGGAIIGAQIDVWKPTQTDWEHVDQYMFDQPLKSTETVQATLPKGAYACVFQCFVEESINGRYDFDFSVAGKSTFIDSGDVNNTAAKNDSKVFKDQFVLEVA